MKGKLPLYINTMIITVLSPMADVVILLLFGCPVRAMERRKRREERDRARRGEEEAEERQMAAKKAEREKRLAQFSQPLEDKLSSTSLSSSQESPQEGKEDER